MSLDPHELLLKQKELELLRAKLALVKENGLEFYRPHEKQHAFHSLQAKRRGFFAGNRTGKSECDAAETVAWFIGERTWYKHSFPIYGMREGLRVVTSFHDGHENHPLVRQGIPSYATKQIVITTDWKKVDEIWTSAQGDNPGKLWKFIPKSTECTVRRNHEGCIDRIFAESGPRKGAVIRFTTEQAYNKNPQSSESTDYDRAAIDEPICEDMWKANARSLVDRDGVADFTLTSLRERWIYDKFHAEDSAEQNDQWQAVRATIYDNPYLPPSAVATFLDELSEDEKACRANGIPLELSGLVYKTFSRDKHLLKELPLGWTSWTNPPLNWTIYVSIDVHEQTNQAALFVAVPPKGVPIIYDEIWRNCVADELAEEVKLRIAGRTVGFIKADPRAWNEDPVYRVSMAQRFQAAGLNVEQASKAKAFGVTNLQSLFKREHIEPASGNRTPEVYCAPTVRRFLWEIARYHFDKENKPIDKDDHFMECAYRIFIVPLVHVDPTLYSRVVPEFDIPMTRRAIREFDDDMKHFASSVGFNN